MMKVMADSGKAESVGANRSLFGAIVVTGCWLIGACSATSTVVPPTTGEEPQSSDRVSVRVVVSVSGQGTTVPPVGTTEFPVGQAVRFQAVAAAGFEFVRWSGDVESRSSSPVVVMDRDLFLTAEFAAHATLLPPKFFLPWATGESRIISQGNDGAYSHVDRFAWDFPMPTGTPILAVAAGRVIDVRQNSAADARLTLEVGAPANFVSIDHGGGSTGLYAHLDTFAALVIPGQLVARGQVIGYAGNTGFSTAPHLHYEVFDIHGRSAPSAFFETDEHGGNPPAGVEIVSENTLNVATADSFVPSLLPRDAFIENQIELTQRTTPAFFYHNETDYVLHGLVLDGKTRVCVALVDTELLETVFCEFADPDDDGAFDARFRFPANLEGTFFFGVISGDEVAEGLAPREIIVQRPAESGDRPSVSIAAPDDSTIDFFETASLTALSPESHDDRPLNYQWAQVSGPPADIADPTAPETVFTILPGPGSTRVAFQLTVFDSLRSSLPAEIEFTMPDTFTVSAMGVTDQPCTSSDECERPGEAAVSLSAEEFTGWIELVNVEQDDALEFVLVDPGGAARRIEQWQVPTTTAPISFWRFVWPASDLPLTLGVWSAIFTRNGTVEASVEFSVVPQEAVGRLQIED